MSINKINTTSLLNCPSSRGRGALAVAFCSLATLSACSGEVGQAGPADDETTGGEVDRAGELEAAEAPPVLDRLEGTQAPSSPQLSKSLNLGAPTTRVPRGLGDNPVFDAVRTQATTKSYAFVQISGETAEALKSAGSVDLSVVPGWQGAALIDEARLSPSNATVLDGRIPSLDGRVAFVERNGGVHMAARGQGKSAMLEPLGFGDWHIVYTQDASKYGADDDNAGQPGEGEGQTKHLGIEPCEWVTVLVGYAEDAAAAHNDIWAHAELSVASSNQTLADSGVTHRFVLVGAEDVSDFQESGSAITDIDNLTDANDPDLGVLHTRRNELFADVVVLMGANYWDVCGVAEGIGVGAADAFAVADENCAINNFTFVHEIGHLAGLRHDNDPGIVPFDFAHGTVQTGLGWRTVMGVATASAETRIGRFSSPDVLWGGTPTGNVAFRDNVHGWEDASCFVSEFRGCSNECPHGGWFDGVNCQLGQAPSGTSAFIWGGNYYYTPLPGNSCPLAGSWFDGANCFVQPVPPATEPFIWANHWYYKACPDCSGWFSGAVGSFSGTLDMANLDAAGHFLLGTSDVTGDGRADLVSVHTSGSAFVWAGQPSGNFASAVSSFAGTLNMANLDGTGHYLVGVEDVTGDGRADLVSVHTSGTAYVWPGQTGGNFGSAVASFSGTLNLANIDGNGHFIVGLGDVDGDGRADLVSGATDGSAYVWPGQSSGHFGGAVSSFAGTLNMANIDGSGHYLLDVADVTGDGRADLVSSGTDGSAYVWPGQSSLNFGGVVSSFAGTLNMANLDGEGHHLIAVSDVDGDGNADLVSAHDAGSAYVWPGTDSGQFGGAVAAFCGTLNPANHDGEGHFMLDVADVTGDGHADLVSSHLNGSAYVWPAD